MKIILRIILAGLLLFAAAEGFFRLFVTQDALVYQDSRDPSLGFELKPNARGIKSGALVEINSAGLRERDIPFEKPAGEFRIVAVGDHFTFGLGIAVEEDYVRLLEQVLPRAQGKTVRTVNLSMYSYNFQQKLALLRSRGLRYDPDFIVLQVSARDFNDLPKPFVRLPGLKNWIRGHSAFLRWAFERIFWSRKPEERVGPPDPESVLRALKPLQRLLNEEAKVPALLVYCPDPSIAPARDGGRELPDGKFEAAGRKLGLPYFSLAKEFARSKEVVLLRAGDPWLNASAHRIAARAVGRELRRLIPAKKKPSQRPGV